MSIEAEIPYIMQCVATKYDPLLHEIEERFNRAIAHVQNRMPVSPEVVAELRSELAEANAALEKANQRDAQRIVELEQHKIAVRDHNAKMEAVPSLEHRPKTPAEGLRFLATWFDAMYGNAGTGNDQVQQDLRRWADELELLK